ncbi:hypothetical protein FRC12_018559 [Ceratobasidium sp. 428]|nr:hypothetical protein FRC12_018559 [Ceratobasidium sp. 428]
MLRGVCWMHVVLMGGHLTYPSFYLTPTVIGILMTQAQPSSSPVINKLPDPVLSDIFVLACRYGEAICMSNQACLAPCYVLSSVSHRWRTIALSTSRIWSSVNALYRAEHLVTHLTRSGEAAIDVFLNLTHLNAPHPVEDLQKSLGLLKIDLHWRRIRSLEVELNEEFYEDSNAAIYSLNSIIDTSPLCNIQTIAVRFTDDSDRLLKIPNFDKPHPRLSLSYSPTLRSVRLDQVYLSLTHVLHTPLPGLQLIEITRVNLGLSNLLYPLLSVSPNLTEMRLRSCSFWHGASDFSQLPSITLAKLETLSIYYVENLVPLSTMLCVCDLPSLKSLVLVVEPFLASMEEESNVNWGTVISRHNTIEKLHIGSFTSEMLAHLQSKMENLNQLIEFKIESDKYMHLGTRRIRYLTLQHLTLQLLETSCCPMLQVLYLEPSLSEKTMESIHELRLKRPSLHVWVRSEGKSSMGA